MNENDLLYDHYIIVTFSCRLSAANNHPDVAGCLETGDYAYCHAPIQTGDHSGNHFTIVVRDVTVDDEVVAMAVRGVGERGFVNYFGPQRFGGGTSSARVALAMLRGEHVSGRVCVCVCGWVGILLIIAESLIMIEFAH